MAEAATMTGGVARREYPTPMGVMLAVARASGLRSLGFVGGDGGSARAAAGEPATAALLSGSAVEARRHLDQLQSELAAYFAGEPAQFRVALDPDGTAFQHAVWHVLRTIPWGQRVSYTWVAERLGRPDAVRAVAAANGANPIAIIVPCHRVVGKDGALVGYAGGLDRKRRLLEIESAAPLFTPRGA